MRFGSNAGSVFIDSKFEAALQMSDVSHLNKSNFYGGKSPRDVPFFRIKEAARAVDRMPESTLRSWAKQELFVPAQTGRPITLSFNNLVEARVLRALRVKHLVKLEAIRSAIDYAENKLGVTDLLLRRDLVTDGSSLLIGHYGKHLDLNPSVQLKLSTLLNQALARVEWDSDEFAQRFYPAFDGDDDEKVVYLDPELSFGHTVVSERAISTNIIYNRFNYGESADELAEDYRILRSEVEQAILFEEAA